MAKQKKQTLEEALDVNPRFRHGEMLRWLLSEALNVIGIERWEIPPPEAMPHVNNALHVYERRVAEGPPFTDVLGDCYMQLVSRWGESALGQFFTPQPVARMMAEMTLFDAQEKARDGVLIRACDPAVGSGVMMLSLLQAICQRNGLDALRNWSVTGIDLDPVCARMFALQVVANCAIHRLEVGEVVAYHGDALGPLDAVKVVLHATAPSTARVMPSDHPSRMAAVVEAVREHRAPAI